MKYKISVVILYCSNDYRFIAHAISHVLPFAHEILVAYYDTYADGTPENTSLLRKTIRENKKAQFIKLTLGSPRKEFPHVVWRIHKFLQLPLINGTQYYIGKARYDVYKKVSPTASHILFLDADEIVDTSAFQSFLKKSSYIDYNAIKLANYWYFRKPTIIATTYEDSPIMVKNVRIPQSFFLTYKDRQGIYEEMLGKKKRKVLGIHNKPMVHHYGWCRTKKELLKKVSSWGHNRETDWKTLIENEFAKKDMSNKDFVQGYMLKRVKPFISFPDF